MPILVLKPKEHAEPPGGDDEVVLSAMDRRLEQRLITPRRIGIAAGSLAARRAWRPMATSSSV